MAHIFTRMAAGDPLIEQHFATDGNNQRFSVEGRPRDRLHDCNARWLAHAQEIRGALE